MAKPVRKPLVVVGILMAALGTWSIAATWLGLPRSVELFSHGRTAVGLAFGTSDTGFIPGILVLALAAGFLIAARSEPGAWTGPILRAFAIGMGVSFVGSIVSQTVLWPVRTQEQSRRIETGTFCAGLLAMTADLLVCWLLRRRAHAR